MLNKDKLKHLPFNLFWCLSSGLAPFFILKIFTDMNIIYILLISVYMYLQDVKEITNIDYLEEKIKKLQDRFEKDNDILKYVEKGIAEHLEIEDEFRETEDEFRECECDCRSGFEPGENSRLRCSCCGGYIK